jgi:hypothetical protein
MWWVPAGHRPTIQEAVERLEHLKANGASEHAFGWEPCLGTTLEVGALRMSETKEDA